MCVFCNIIEGSIPSKKVYEDDDVLAILDLSQLEYGHTLVMPKKHCENILDVDKDTLAKTTEVVRILSKKITTNLNAVGANIVSNAKEGAGQAVMHLHFHIIPRYENDDFGFKEVPHQYDLDEVLIKVNG